MKRFVFFTIIIVSLFVMQNMARSIYSLWQKRDLLVQRENELTKQKQEHARLIDVQRRVESEEFVEKEARNKLFLQKPGESRVVVDKKLIDAVAGVKTEEKKDNRPNWQQWWELFF